MSEKKGPEVAKKRGRSKSTETSSETESSPAAVEHKSEPVKQAREESAPAQMSAPETQGPTHKHAEASTSSSAGTAPSTEGEAAPAAKPQQNNPVQNNQQGEFRRDRPRFFDNKRNQNYRDNNRNDRNNNHRRDNRNDRNDRNDRGGDRYERNDRQRFQPRDDEYSSGVPPESQSVSEQDIDLNDILLTAEEKAG